MIFRLTFTERSLKDIDKLDGIVRKRISKKLTEYLTNPLANSEPLIESKYGSRRFRIGNYRVTFDIFKDQIVILRVGHRREIYR